MSMHPLIGLGGYAKAGKDTVADRLVTVHGYHKTYMSKPLEKALLTLNPQIPVGPAIWVPGTFPKRAVGYETWMSYAHLHDLVGYDESKNNVEVRRLLQVLGTEIGRNMFSPTVWIDMVFAEAEMILDAGESVAITGIRYANELEMIHNLGGLAVWVSRPGFGPVNGHSSDNTLGPEDFEVTLDNDGTLEDLYEHVVTLTTLDVIE